MITKPQDWETAQAYTGETQQVTPGGHIVRIMGMVQGASREGKPMIIVSFDIDEGGELDGFYRRQYDARKQSDPYNAKWGGVIRYMLYDKSGKATNGFFKGFIGAVEESNPGYKWNWDERTIAGKLVGMVFGEEEYRGQNGDIRTSVKAQMARSVQAIRDGVAVPKKKTLQPESAAPGTAYGGFTDMGADLPLQF